MILKSALLIALFVIQVDHSGTGTKTKIEKGTLDSILINKIKDFSVEGKSPLEALLSISKETSCPLGIVVSDDKLVSKMMSFSMHNVTTLDIINRIVQDVQGYVVNESDGVVIVKNSEDVSSDRLLKISFAEFDTHIPMNYTQISETLWGYLQMKINPKRTGYGGVLQIPPEDKISDGPFKLSNVNVQNILDAITVKHGSMAWILWPVPEVLVDKPQYRLWNFVFYPVSERGNRSCCVFVPRELTTVPDSVRLRLEKGEF